MFNDEKWGYNKKEVDTYLIKNRAEVNSTISDLKAQNIELKAEIEELNASLKNYKNNEDSIKDAMILAAKKTKEIEEQAAREYKIECDKIKKLYFKWIDIIESVKKKYGLINVEELNVRRFYLDIEKLFENNLPAPRPSAEPVKREVNNIIQVDNVDDEQKIHHKQLLSRMSGLLHSVSTSVKAAENRKLNNFKIATEIKPQQPREEYVAAKVENSFAEKEYKKETERLETVKETSVEQNNSKPLNNTIKSLKSYSSLLDKYLSLDDEEDDDDAYAKIITNSSDKQEITHNEKTQLIAKELNLPQVEMGKGTNGFDLKEAVNPKQSLEEIMQAFDI